MMSTDQRISALIASARTAAANGQQQQAQLLLRQAEADSPRHPLVLNEIAIQMLVSGNPAGAAVLLEEAARSEAASWEVFFHLAIAFRRLDRLEEALATLQRVLKVEPRSLATMLEMGSLEEQRERPRAAAMHYRTALQMVPPGVKLSQPMERQLQHARVCVEANNRALEIYIEDGLRDVKAKYPGAPFHRFEQCVDMILQKRRPSRQQPTFLFFPELPAIEFYDRNLFPWLDTIEAAADAIKAELLEVLAEGSDVLDPYVQERPADEWRELNNSRRWGVYPFWREGKPFPKHMARCPRTTEALEAWPRWDVPGSGPTALFSILDARTRIPAHTGPVNTRLVVHLPLIVPHGCGFRVGGQQRQWQPGKAFVFDDSINHEAWNDSDQPRAVMIFDTWSPFLSEAERDLTRSLTAYIGEFYGLQSNSNML